MEKDRANVPAVFHTMKPASVMVFGLVTSKGKKMPLHFFGTKEKVNTKVYLELLMSKVIPWLEENVEGPYIFIQDSTPAHKAKKTLKFLADHMHTFWEPTTRPSNSPDLNVLNYDMKGEMERQVGANCYESVWALKASINWNWDAIDGMSIISASKAFRHCIEQVIAAKGGHIE